MAVRQVVSCDVCNIDKGDINHWFTIRLRRDLDTLNLDFQCSAGVREMENSHHVCGAACASILYQRFLSTGQLEANPVIGVTEEINP